KGLQIDQVVVDTICQDFSCPADISGVADLNQCSAGVTWTLPTPDSCTVREPVTCTTNGVAVTSGDTFPVGVTAVSCTFNDAENQPFSCNFNVTIADTQDPVINCPPAGSFQCASAVPAPATDYASFVAHGGSASDNCTMPPTVTWEGDVISDMTCAD